MRVFISGGTGFVGRELALHLLDQGHAVTATGRRETQSAVNHPRFHYIGTDTTQTGSWQDSVAVADWVINLAGQSILGRWNEQYKEQLRESRIQSTRNIVDALSIRHPPLFFSASAVGYYGDQGDSIITEKSAAADDFLGCLAVEWEQAALAAREKGCRVVLTRFGVVLGKEGGAFHQMVTPFRWYAGGPMGSGQQWFSWIHMADLINAFGFIAKRNDLEGPFNFCTPHPVRNRTLAKALGQALGRPALLPAPAVMLKLVLGEFAETLLVSQRMIPQRLMDSGFTFQCKDIDTALADLAR